MILIVAGVSGSGKTTVGAMLAARLGWRFADADEFHLAANIEKMRAGIPLTDDDRWPWLRAIGAWMDERIARNESAVITCSALKGDSIADLWSNILKHRDRLTASGELAGRRGEQQVKWMWTMLEERLFAPLRSDRTVKAELPKIEAEVSAGRLAPAAAVEKIAAMLDR